MLVLCTVIWGGTFPAVKYALESCSPWLIVAMRFAIAGVLFALFLRGAIRNFNWQILSRGIILGLFFFAGFGLQTLGLQYTSPSRSAFRAAAAKQGLAVRGEYAFGADYARTLGEWRRAFEANWPQIAALGFDEQFRRLWRLYLGYCEAGFRNRLIRNYQLVLNRMGESGGAPG